MDKDLIKEILNNIEKDFYKKTNKYSINQLFEDRAENIYSDIAEHEVYKQYINKAIEMENKVVEKLGNSEETMQLLEDINKFRCEYEYLSRKLIYKHGVSDGMRLVIEGTEQINIKKIIMENE